MRAAISIDLGTHGCRAAAIDESGETLAAHHVEYGLSHPEPGAAEQEAEGWWSAGRACVKAVVDGLGDPSVVVAMGVSAQGHSWVPTDRHFRPLRPALTWLDTRAGEVADHLLRSRGARYWADIAGKAPGPWHTLPQILWLREREPSVERQAARFLFAHDFLIARLTGRAATDYTTAAGSLMFNIASFDWDRTVVTHYRVSPERFAQVAAPGSLAGALQWETAKDLGLPPGIPVVVGAQDQKCAALGAGLCDRAATASLGTATAITAIARRPHYDEATPIPCFPYLHRDSWVLEAPLTTTGGAFRWLRDTARGWGARDIDFDGLTRLAESAFPGAGGVRFLPFLAGAGAPHWRGDARGAFMGLGLDTGPEHMARALLESVAFEIRTNLGAMQQGGVRIDRLRVFGGGARSDLWVQIIADALGIAVERSANVETASLGAAMIALAGAGVFGSIEAAQQAMSRPADIFPPVEGTEYETVYEDYCRRRDAFLMFGRTAK